MSDQHLFTVGELVSLTFSRHASAHAGDVFTVKMQMPPLGGDLQYRIKSPGESYERVVTEAQLTKFSFQPDAAPAAAAAV
jgi:hypothetical protein